MVKPITANTGTGSTKAPLQKATGIGAAPTKSPIKPVKNPIKPRTK
jgi:hypothetical protein